MGTVRWVFVLVVAGLVGCKGCKKDGVVDFDDVVLESCSNGEDDNGNGLVDCAEPRCQVADACVFEPPNPEDIAPPAAISSAGFVDSVRFLWEGDNPVIRDVDVEALDLARLAVLRAKVTDAEGEPVAGVRANVGGRPEFGYTFSRADGMVDLVANGGEVVHVRTGGAGFLTVDREVTPEQLTYAWADDVVITRLDATVTEVDLSKLKRKGLVASSTPVEDESGVRTARIYFPPNTTAVAQFADGQRGELSTASIRLTEYTVGERGDAAMPAVLPEDSGYTYAVELSVDEARAAGAQEVTFSQPVYLYIDNFLDFEVGSPVPAGFYLRSARVWDASANGVVMRKTAGGTEPDLDLTKKELKQLEVLYAEGDTFWRVPIEHFSPIDCNWPYEFPEDAVDPNEIPDFPSTRDKDPCAEAGSVIECQNQVLSKSLALPGTPHSLVYRSDRVVGSGRGFDFPLTGDEVPESLMKIIVTVDLAGVYTRKEYEPAPNLTHVFEWDRKDAYGRDVSGKWPIKVAVGFVYEIQYTRPPNERAFAAAGGEAIGDGRLTLPIWRRYGDLFGSFDAQAAVGLGGWSLDIAHQYDAGRQTFYPADSPERTGREVGRVIRVVETFGATPSLPFNVREMFTGRIDVGVGNDDSLLIGLNFSEGTDALVRRRRDGSLEHVAGKHVPNADVSLECFQGCDLDGPATEATLPTMKFNVASDGTPYILQGQCFYAVRDNRLEPAGACSGDRPDDSEDFPNSVESFAVAPDGSILITNGSKIWRLNPGSRRITRLAGCNGDDCVLADFTPRRGTSVDTSAHHLTLSPTGDVYFADRSNGRVAVLDTAGNVRLVIGDEDGADIRGLSFGRDGRLYGFVLDGFSMQVGMLQGASWRTLAGADLTQGNFNPEDLSFLADEGEPVPATTAIILPFGNLAADSAGRVYLGTNTGAIDEETDADIIAAIQEIASVYPEYVAGVDEALLASLTGRHLYRFDVAGRMIERRSTWNDLVLHTLDYGDDGLNGATDVDGLATVIERAPDGTPTAIVGPYGHRTELSLDGNGFLSDVTYPDGSARSATYNDYGLMQAWRDGESGESNYEYDSVGRLVRAESSDGSWKTLTRTRTGVVMESSTGRTVAYDTDPAVLNQSSTTVTNTAGLVWQSQSSWGTADNLVEPNGTVRSMVLGSDPRFGLQSRYVRRRTTTTPGGLEQVSERRKTVELEDPADFSRLASLTESITINDAETTYVYDGAAHSVLRTSPTGRTVQYTFDDRNRATSVAVGRFEALQLSYDQDGRVDNVSHGGSRLDFVYGSDGQLAEVTDVTGATTRATRDEWGRFVSFTSPSGTVRSSDYDGNGLVRTTTPGPGSSYTTQFDMNGRLIGFEYPSADEDSFTWTADRNIASVQPANGDVQTIERDDGQRVTGWTTSAGRVQREYDATTGQVTRSESRDGSVEFSYDGFIITGRTVAFDGQSHTIARQFDDNFRITRRDVAGESVSLEYDDDGLLTRAGAATLTYDSTAPVLTDVTVEQIDTTYAITPSADIDGITHSRGGTVIYEADYTLGSAGRLTAMSETIEGATTQFAYDYDLDGQLLEVRRDNVPEATFTYDARGNRTTVPAGAATFDPSDRILRAGTRTYVTDPSGFVTSWTDGPTTTQLIYDGHDLIEVDTGTAVVAYGYDSFGRRIWRKVDGTLDKGWVYDDLQRPHAEVDATGAVVSRFVYGTNSLVPAYMVRAGRTYRLVAEPNLTVRLVVDAADGTIVQRIDYDPLGQVIADTNPGFQPFGYAGGLHDSNTGLVRFGAREYDPYTGRWTSPDPRYFAGGEWNLYVYAHNDGINFIDPQGKAAQIVLLKGLVVGSVVFAAAVIDNLILWKKYEKESNRRATALAKKFGQDRYDFENAMRHCTWQCETSRARTSAAASLFGAFHEAPLIPKRVGGGGSANRPGGSTYQDRLKDEPNNKCGQANAEKDGECLDLCEADLANGRLATDRPFSDFMSVDPGMSMAVSSQPPDLQ